MCYLWPQMRNHLLVSLSSSGSVVLKRANQLQQSHPASSNTALGHNRRGNAAGGASSSSSSYLEERQKQPPLPPQARTAAVNDLLNKPNGSSSSSSSAAVAAASSSLPYVSAAPPASSSPTASSAVGVPRKSEALQSASSNQRDVFSGGKQLGRGGGRQSKYCTPRGTYASLRIDFCSLHDAPRRYKGCLPECFPLFPFL